MRRKAPPAVERSTGQEAFRFAVASLAVWRATHLLALEDGPGAAIARVRGRLGTGAIGELADCFACLSVWVAAPFAPYVSGRRSELPALWLALSGAAFVLERTLGEAPAQILQLEGAEREEFSGVL
jgi:hypothetical protein